METKDGLPVVTQETRYSFVQSLRKDDNGFVHTLKDMFASMHEENPLVAGMVSSLITQLTDNYKKPMEALDCFNIATSVYEVLRRQSESNILEREILGKE